MPAVRARRDHAQEITDAIVARLETVSATDFKLPWRGAPAAPPCRVAGEGYRGINRLLLTLVQQGCGYASPYWMTYRQAGELGGQVRRGEKGTGVVYYGTARARDGAAEGSAVSGAPLPSPSAAPAPTNDGDAEAGHYRFLKGYTVFNASQVDGLPARFLETSEPLDTDAGARPIEAHEAFFERLPIRVTVGGTRACYRPATDDILMPDMHRFEEASRYYSVLAHEHVHATGTPQRLARECATRYGTSQAARAEEELVAELGAAFLCADLGLAADHLDDHAAYVANWLTALKGDKRYIFRASAAAQRAVDWILEAAGRGAEHVVEEAAAAA